MGARQHQLHNGSAVHLGSAPSLTAARSILEAEHHEGVGSCATATAHRSATRYWFASPGTHGQLFEEPRYIGGRQQHRRLFVDRH